MFYFLQGFPTPILFLNYFTNSSIFLNYFLIYLLAALGLHCCLQAFSSCVKQGLLFVEVHGLLIAVASLVAEHRL